MLNQLNVCTPNQYLRHIFVLYINKSVPKYLLNGTSTLHDSFLCLIENKFVYHTHWLLLNKIDEKYASVITWMIFRENRNKAEHVKVPKYAGEVKQWKYNFCIEAFEQRALKDFPGNSPRLWLRYVGDTFVIVNQAELNHFFVFINNVI